MGAENKMLLIRNYDLWRHISDEEYEELNFVHRFVEAKKGAYIYFEAFNHNKLYFLKEGYIRIGFIDENGKEVIREIIQKGELFGQFTLEKNNLHGEFARAYKADVSLCAFNIEDFEKLLVRKPEIALKYTRQVGNKLRQVQNRMLNLLNKDVKTRLLGLFWQLLQMNMTDRSADGFCIPDYLTHEDLAHLVGASRQTVTAVINELAAAQLFSYKHRQICFPDVKEIEKLLNVG
ncbi:MAG: Crp/Fnr family transcriptional regulator [Chitinophagaceae bacterium]